jgi:hypothetical protein
MRFFVMRVEALSGLDLWLIPSRELTRKIMCLSFEATNNNRLEIFLFFFDAGGVIVWT